MVWGAYGRIYASIFLFMPQFSHILYYDLMSSEAMVDEILTLKEVADYLKLAEKTAYRLAADGKLPGFKVGGSWRFKREDVSTWIEEQKSNNKG
jgi:excisionase family DNA binding protein